MLDRLEAQQQRDDGSAELELAPDETSLDFLQKVYRSSGQPLATRMRAAAIALPFESPKLTAMAVSSMNGDHFAAMLERAIARSQAPLKQIELKAKRPPLASLGPAPRQVSDARMIVKRANDPCRCGLRAMFGWWWRILGAGSGRASLEGSRAGRGIASEG